MLGKTLVHPILTYAIEIAPIQSVIVLIFGLYVVIAKTRTVRKSMLVLVVVVNIRRIAMSDV